LDKILAIGRQSPKIRSLRLILRLAEVPSKAEHAFDFLRVPSNNPVGQPGRLGGLL